MCRQKASKIIDKCRHVRNLVTDLEVFYPLPDFYNFTGKIAACDNR